MTDKPRHWPADVEPMIVEQFEKLGVNSRNQLFWDGKRVGTRLDLSLPQTMLAILAAIASLATIATGLNNAATFLCARDVQWLGCPQAVAQPGAVPPVAPSASVPAR